MIYDRIDEVVAEIVSQYKMMQSGMLLSLSIHLDQGARDPQRFTQDIRSHRQLLNGTTTPFEGGLVQEAAVEIMDEFTFGLSLDRDQHKVIDTAVAQGVDSALSAVRDYARWDENLILKAAAQVRLHASMQGSLLSPGRVAHASVGIVSGFQFRRTDRAGRLYLTTTAVATTVRATLVDTYVESALYARAVQGRDVAVAVHPSGERTTFSITGYTPDLPTYADLKNKIWHPNSRVLVENV
jgi:hypothetical protein